MPHRLLLLCFACTVPSCGGRTPDTAVAPQPTERLDAREQRDPIGSDPAFQGWIDDLDNRDWRVRNAAARSLHARLTDAAAPTSLPHATLVELVELDREPEPEDWMFAFGSPCVSCLPPTPVLDAAAAYLTGSAFPELGQPDPSTDFVRGASDLIVPWTASSLANWLLCTQPRELVARAIEEVRGTDRPNAALWLHVARPDDRALLGACTDEPGEILGALVAQGAVGRQRLLDLALPSSPAFRRARLERILCFAEGGGLPVELAHDAARLALDGDDWVSQRAANALLSPTERRAQESHLDAVFAVAGTHLRHDAKLAAFAHWFAPVDRRHAQRLWQCLDSSAWARAFTLAALHGSDLLRFPAADRKRIAASALATLWEPPEASAPLISYLEEHAIAVADECACPLADADCDRLLGQLADLGSSSDTARIVGMLHRSGRLPPMQPARLRDLAVQPRPTVGSLVAVFERGEASASWWRALDEHTLRPARKLGRALAECDAAELRTWLDRPPIAIDDPLHEVAIEGLFHFGLLSETDFAAHADHPALIELRALRGRSVGAAIESLSVSQFSSYAHKELARTTGYSRATWRRFVLGYWIEPLRDHPTRDVLPVLRRWLREPNDDDARVRVVAALCCIETDEPLDPAAESTLRALDPDSSGWWFFPLDTSSVRRLPSAYLDAMQRNYRPDADGDGSIRRLLLRFRGDPARRKLQ